MCDLRVSLQAVHAARGGQLAREGLRARRHGYRRELAHRRSQRALCEGDRRRSQLFQRRAYLRVDPERGV
eukprot:5509367-Pleurochrysis_carterae.AAC.2